MRPQFRDDLEKWQWLLGVADADAADERVKDCADALWHAALGRPRWFAFLAHALVRDCIHFETDTARTGGEHFQPWGQIGEVLASGGPDDCDTKVRLFVALCRAKSIGAVAVPHWQQTPEGWKLRHVSARCNLPSGPLLVETTLARARLGETHDDVPKEATGKWRT